MENDMLYDIKALKKERKMIKQVYETFRRHGMQQEEMMGFEIARFLKNEVERLELADSRKSVVHAFVDIFLYKLANESLAEACVFAIQFIGRLDDLPRHP